MEIFYDKKTKELLRIRNPDRNLDLERLYWENKEEKIKRLFPLDEKATRAEIDAWLKPFEITKEEREIVSIKITKEEIEK